MSDMDGFGRRLRLERERRKISLASIAETTKISVPLLEGLERDDLARWPSGIFRRSFVRAYAEAVGLDADAIVREFLDRFHDPDEPPPLAEAPPGADTPPPLPSVAALGWAKIRTLVRQPNADPVSSDHRPTPQDSAPAGGSLMPPRGVTPALRLRIVDAVRAFRRGDLLANSRRRWAAVACDIGVLLAIALAVFVVVGRFWEAVGLIAFGYYGGGILFLGNTPGVCLFAPDPPDRR